MSGAAKARLRSFLATNPYGHAMTEGFFYREKMRAIHAVAPDGPLNRILEVGGGQSGLTAVLYPGATVVNVDLDLSYADAPGNRDSGTVFACADATRLPFADGSFAAVTLFDVLEHIPADGAAAAEAMRVLRPGGYILVTSPNERWRFPYYRVLRPVCPTDAAIMAEWGHVRRGYTLERLDELFGLPHQASATFITPATVVGHDLSFSRLPARAKRVLCAAVGPLSWSGYWLHRPSGRGTETAARWQKR
jgi:SAM-dependent methyltransferase